MTSRIAQLGKQFLNMASKSKTDITLYTVNTPNGIKASILLEELGLDYKVSEIIIHSSFALQWRSQATGLLLSAKD